MLWKRSTKCAYMKKLMFVLASLALTVFSAQGIYAQCSSNQAKAVKASYTTGAEKDVVDIAIGSNCELETQLELATHFGYLDKEQGREFLQELARNRKMMITFVEKKLKD